MSGVVFRLMKRRPAAALERGWRHDAVLPNPLFRASCIHPPAGSRLQWFELDCISWNPISSWAGMKFALTIFQISLKIAPAWDERQK